MSRDEAKVVLCELGRRPYREVWDFQKEIHAAVVAGMLPPHILFVEHEPVITLGRNAEPDNMKFTVEMLAQRGVDCVAVERGGDVTYHGPGQFVVYPIMRLERFREVVPLVRKLEGAAIEVCAKFGITAERWREHAGVWVGDKQICAIGLAIQKMVSLHGIALNVSTTLTYDEYITPCGLPDRGITSISAEIGRIVEPVEVREPMLHALENALAIRLIPQA